MIHSEQPLYPKLSSIYNKIMQLAIAILLLIVVMNLWVFSYSNTQQATKEHFNDISEQYLTQIVNASTILLQNKSLNTQQYFNEVAANAWIKDVSYYDHKGLLKLASNERSSVKDLFGVSSNRINKSDDYSLFVQEINANGNTGYIRLTVENAALTKHLDQAAYQHFELVRLMMIIAVVIGFFLTRGLNRFSRQGFRLSYSK